MFPVCDRSVFLEIMGDPFDLREEFSHSLGQEPDVLFGRQR